MNATIEDTHPDYTDARIATEYNDALSPKISEMVMESKSGYWMQYQDFSMTQGQYLIRVPPRALILSKVEISNANNTANFGRLPEVMEGHADLFSSPVTALGSPRAYVMRGDNIWLFPRCDASGYTVRAWYFIRPSLVVKPQPDPFPDVKGTIAAVNTTARTLLVGQLPYDMSLASPAAITSGSNNIDVVSASGWHELSLVNATQTLAAMTITVGGTQSMDRIQVGDKVRVTGQSDWPPIPDDFHRMLCDIVSSKILAQLDNAEKAAPIFQDAAADMARFSRLISDRTLEEPRTLRPYYTGSLGRYVR